MKNAAAAADDEPVTPATTNAARIGARTTPFTAYPFRVTCD